MAIQSEIVRGVREIYEWWWNGIPSDWAYFTHQAQAAVNGHIATLPVPTMDLCETRPLTTIPEGNPLTMEPKLIAPRLNGDFGRYAESVAQALIMRGHIVFFVTRTTALNAHWSNAQEDKQSIQDILAYAPVVVFYDNPDGHQAESIDNMLRTAQCGIRVVVARSKGVNGGR